MEININKTSDKLSYSDLDLLFKIHPIKKDLTTNKGADAINKSIRNLLLTNYYERLFHPEIGCNVRKLLFELNGSFTTNVLEKEIYNVIKNFEPRVNLISINVYYAEDDENSVIADISYYLLNSDEVNNLKIPFPGNIF